MQKYTRKDGIKKQMKGKNKLRKRKEEHRRRKISGRNDDKRKNFIDGTTVLYTVSRTGV
jgi:hypothetical protein